MIDILRKYNFTVEENTPTDVEVSLDPELLGKVFENLLASYNPETGENARKSTGSFYTPREIVQFMVDESLLAYLKNHTKVSEEMLRDLLSYSTVSEGFDKGDAMDIMQAIYSCKILDPACGSGAFPMGILQQLVHMLGQLDPDNNYWHDIVLRSAEKDSRMVFQSSMTSEKKIERIQDINESFDENVNSPDYSRKLYLIENCIYGVDIQPIAAQISKLRFFISLVVEQKPTKNNKANFGIRPLPNLDAKFVAANTLLPIAKKQKMLFDDPRIETLQNLQKDACHRLFCAKTARTKRKYEDKISELRAEIAGLLLENKSIGNEDAQLISKWDMFDQNASADFFDAEWMFGLSDSFDIVLGNPPYIQLEKDHGRLASLYENKGYDSFARTGDIYCLFYERGLDMLKDNGVLAFITSNKWMRAGYGEKLRSVLSAESNPLILVDCGGQKIFESATVDVNILVAEKSRNKGITKAAILTKDGKNNLSVFVLQNMVLASFNKSDSWVILSPLERSIKEKIERKGIPLKNWDISINYGIKTGCNEAFIINEAQREQILNSCLSDKERVKTEELIRPILRGRDIKKYKSEWAGLYLINAHNGVKRANNPIERIHIEDFPAVKKHLDQFIAQLEKRFDKGDTPYNLRNCAYIEDFLQQRIAYCEIGPQMDACMLPPGIMINNKLYMISGENLEFLLLFLNSRMFTKIVLASANITGGKGVDFLHKLKCIKPSGDQIEKAKRLLSSSSDEDKETFIESIYGLTEEEITFLSETSL